MQKLRKNIRLTPLARKIAHANSWDLADAPAQKNRWRANDLTQFFAENKSNSQNSNPTLKQNFASHLSSNVPANNMRNFLLNLQIDDNTTTRTFAEIAAKVLPEILLSALITVANVAKNAKIVYASKHIPKKFSTVYKNVEVRCEQKTNSFPAKILELNEDNEADVVLRIFETADLLHIHASFTASKFSPEMTINSFEKICENFANPELAFL